MKLKGKNNYDIIYEEKNIEKSKIIVIAMHGFAGDKNSSCIKLLENKLNNLNYGLIKFDWPSHGESPTNELSIDNCLNDLTSIVEYVKSKNKEAKLVAFSTSFGGYITLLYNYLNGDVFNSIILRSPAIRMYNVINNKMLTEYSKKFLNENHYFIHGFKRKMNVTDKFINSLKINDLFDLYKNKELSNIYIIHGTEDDLVPTLDSKEFCNIHNCKLYLIKGANHRYKNPNELEKVIEISFNILENLN